MKVFVTLALFAVATFAEPPSYRQQQQQQQQQNGNRYFFARQQDQSAAASGPYAPSGWRPEGPAFNLPQRQERQQQQPDSGYGAPEQQQQQQQQYGPPPSNQYGPPQAGLNNLRRPQFARQELPAQQQYGAPSVQEPQQKYGGPSPAPVEQYRAPVRQQQFRAPARQQQYPTAPTPQQYGPPQAPQTQYGPAENQYGGPEYTTTEIPNAAEIDEPTTISQFTESEAESGNNEFEEEADIDNPSGRQQKSQKQQQQQQDRGEYYVALPDGRLQRVRYVSEQDIEAMRYFAKIRAENVEPLRGPIYAYAPLQELEVAPGKLQVSLAPAAPVGSLTVASSDARPQKLQAAPKLDIKPLTQVQLQHDAPASVVPLSSSYTTFTANYQVPAAPADERYILAFP